MARLFYHKPLFAILGTKITKNIKWNSLLKEWSTQKYNKLFFI